MMNPEELRGLLESWLISLAAERKSRETVLSYQQGVRKFLAWADAEGETPALEPGLLNRFTAAQLALGRAPASVRAWQLAVRLFSAWLAEEREIEHDRLLGVKPPKLDQKVVDTLTEDQIRALLATCRPNTFLNRRDEAIIRLMIETGARPGEVGAMLLDDLDVGAGVATIRRGKGGKGRRAAFGAATAKALDRYVRLRRAHPLAATPALWLGGLGQRFGYDGLYSALCRRAEQAGIAGFYPHRLRNVFAMRWLAAGGSEGGLMAAAGWARRDMIDRYAKATEETRAMEEARRLNLGDL